MRQMRHLLNGRLGRDVQHISIMYEITPTRQFTQRCQFHIRSPNRRNNMQIFLMLPAFALPSYND